MTATLDGVTNKNKPEPAAEAKAAEELVRQAREQGLSLTGPDGLLKQLTKTVLETALSQDLTEHLGHEKHGPAASGQGTCVTSGNSGDIYCFAPGPPGGRIGPLRSA